MANATIDYAGRVEALARYLGAMFPTAGIERYEDSNVVGFRFIGAPHASVEFEREWLASLPANADVVAEEMHLHHVCAEINDTPETQRVIFGSAGVRRA
ncbi:MAG TPA: hypothetical protein VJP85_12725 [Candidatus Baltobacteraceae bacterium]|nr:hypothetical protein [Candidatus Baltobacteraceae bacterium]